MKPRLFASFSGGRTSARMTKELRDELGDTHDIKVLFSNSGKEDQRTLDFVAECDLHFGFGTVWLEAVVSQRHGVGTAHKVVTYETASRDGEPFERVIEKYGIPNKNYPHCTRELKLQPMRSYLRSIGWEKGTYETAVGIRADESDRMSASAEREGIIYPLIRKGVRKHDVLAWWRQQAFDLRIPEHRGNCVFCWKKSDRKLLTLAAEDPTVFDFPARMERQYANAGSGDGGRVFFRLGKSTDDIFWMRDNTLFEPYADGNHFGGDLDMQSACGESCEIGGDNEEESP